MISGNRRAWRPGTVGVVACALLGSLVVGGHAGRADEIVPAESPAVVSAPASSAKPQAVAAVAPNKLSARAALALVRAEKDPYWLNAQEVTATTDDLMAQDQAVLARGMRHQILLAGDTDKKQIALTFDDGPHPAATLRLLAILKQYNVHATFFLVGKMAEQRPDLVQAEVAAGDCVGNHTYDHVSLVKIPQEYVGTEIKACGEVLHGITDQTPHLFRPPGGVFDPTVAETSEALGYTTVLWTDDPGDYASPGTDLIVSRTIDKATPGGIILLHDGPEQTLEALPQIIEILRERGFQFVTIDQMLAEKQSHHDITPGAVVAAK
jgi:peptidoglycan/xylan/chitin deacetylase (PgdA/CDA1 family)